MKEREIIRHCPYWISSFWPLIGLHEGEREIIRHCGDWISSF